MFETISTQSHGCKFPFDLRSFLSLSEMKLQSSHFSFKKKELNDENLGQLEERSGLDLDDGAERSGAQKRTDEIPFSSRPILSRPILSKSVILLFLWFYSNFVTHTRLKLHKRFFRISWSKQIHTELIHKASRSPLSDN